MLYASACVRELKNRKKRSSLIRTHTPNRGGGESTVRVPRSTPYSLSTYCSSMGDISTPGSSPPDSALSFKCCSSCSSAWTRKISSRSRSRCGTRGTSGKRGRRYKDKGHEIVREYDEQSMTRVEELKKMKKGRMIIR